MLETSSGRDRRASRAVARVFSANNPCLPGRAFLHRGVCQEHAASETEGERADHGSNSDQIRTQRERHVDFHCPRNERARHGGSSCDLFARPIGSLGKVPVCSSHHRQRSRVSGSNPRLLRDCFRSTLRSCYPTNEGQRGQSQSVFVPLPLRVKLRPRSAGASCPF
jgi:hypothetical protein